MTFNRLFVLCCSLVVLLALVTNEQVRSATTYTEDEIAIREGTVTYGVTVPGTWTKYANNEDCGNPAHRTANGQRFFEHIHNHYSFPITGKDSNNVMREVNVQNVKAYWDNLYGFGSDGGESPAYNCYSHAFGISDTWVQGNGAVFIYADDYPNPKNIPEENDVIPQGDHAIKVTEVHLYPEYGNGMLVARTSEKNRFSGIYNIIYWLPGGSDHFDTFRRKQ